MLYSTRRPVASIGDTKESMALAVFAQQNYDAQSFDVSALVSPVQALVRRMVSAPSLNKDATVLNVNREATPEADTLAAPSAPTRTAMETAPAIIDTVSGIDWRKWLPWILIALAVFALLYALSKKSRKGAT